MSENKKKRWYLKGDQILERNMDSVVCTIDGLDADNMLVVEESETNAHLIEAAPETEEQRDALLDSCMDMASILNGLYFGTLIDSIERVDRIREVEKNARVIIALTKKKRNKYL